MLSAFVMRPFSPSTVLVPMLAAAAVLAAVTPLTGQGGAASPSPEHRAAALRATRFVPNRGQWPSEVRYAALGDTMGWLHDDGFTVRHERWSEVAAGNRPTTRIQSGCVVRTRFLDGAAAELVAESPQPGCHSFLRGRGPAVTDVPAFARVRLCAVLPGIDVLFRPLPDDRAGAFEYDLELAPGADLSRFAARCEGASGLAIDADGRLCISIVTPDGPCELVQEAPVAWQVTAAGPRPLRVAFRLLDATSYGFVAADLDPALAAVVDPGVVWGTYLGGGLTERISAMRWQPGTGVWVAGWAGSTDFPTTVGAFRTTGGADGFVARLDDSGSTLQFATYLGGSLGDEIRGLAVGPGNTPTVVGFTRSTDFPLTAGALQSVYAGGSPFLDVGDAFVTTLSANGNALVASTYLGGLFDDVAEAVVVDGTGAPIVVGWTSSPNFPTTAGVLQPGPGGIPGLQSDGFVSRLAPNGQSLLASTLRGGGFAEQFLAIDRHGPSGDLIVCGWTLGADYPVTTNALRPASGGGLDAVITRFNATLTGAVFSTYLGGIDSDVLQAARVAADGTLWFAGFTDSINFPTTLNAPQRVLGGLTDACAVQLSANGTTMLYGTLLGGVGAEKGRGIDVDSVADQVVFVGEAGPGFPTTGNALQSQFGGGNLDGFVAELGSGGSTLVWSSYFGGADQDVLAAVQLGASGLAVVAGWTFSTDYPLGPPAYQPLRRGVSDGVVQQIDLATDLGDSLLVGSNAPAAPSLVAAGEHDFLVALLENRSARPLAIDAVRVLIAGAGDAVARLRNLQFVVLQSGGAPTVVAGPFAPLADDREQDVSLSGCVVPGGGSLQLVLRGELVADPSGATCELACSIVDAGAWTVRAIGAGQGPAVRVSGSGRADGGVLVIGRLPGDLDGDGQQSVVDVRRMLAAVGTVEVAADIDGDALLTPTDLALTQAAVLGRASVFGVPLQWQRDRWQTLRGIWPERRVISAQLGGRSLLVGTDTPRELTLRVDAQQPVGPQELIVTSGGRVLVSRIVDVQ
jgi:hypothetical protein